MAVLDEAQRADIQGNILRAYGFKFGRYSILKIVDPAGARLLLSRLLEQNLIVSAASWDRFNKPDAAINVAFTHSGLAAVGVSQKILQTFPDVFVEGMAARAQELGDTGDNDPAKWEFGNDPATTHVFITVYGRDPEKMAAMLTRLRAELSAAGNGVSVTHGLDVAALAPADEHFGFADGIGQPDIEGSGATQYPGDGTPRADKSWQPIKAGEFVLGSPVRGDPSGCRPRPLARTAVSWSTGSSRST